VVVSKELAVEEKAEIQSSKIKSVIKLLLRSIYLWLLNSPNQDIWCPLPLLALLASLMMTQRFVDILE